MLLITDMLCLTHKISDRLLENDVRPWLEETKLGKNTSERLVFSAIIAEHFKETFS